MPAINNASTDVDLRKVFVVHGRNEALRRSMFDFLRSIGLDPIEWSEAIRLTGKGSPYVGDVLDTAFSVAQAIVVLMTPDDEARLIESYRDSKEPNYETELTPQPRQNVLIEAGMALGRNPDRTILVEIGELRPISDIVGRHTVRMNNSVAKRQDIVDRLETAGCEVSIKGRRDWHDIGNFEIKLQKKIEIEQSQNKSNSPINLQHLDIQILKRISVEENVALEVIISELNINYTYAKHSIDNLLGINYIEQSHTIYGFTVYGLTKEGREYIVSNKLF